MTDYNLKPLIAIFLCLIASCNSSVNESEDQASSSTSAINHPNIILFYVDDLGYADIGSYGAQGISTPHLDRMAEQGIQFMDAHSSAATCTPSRYSLLTGNYAFRNNAAVLPGDAPLLIDTTQMTLPKVLKQAGYETGVVGKWHLGLGLGNVDWNEMISPGPHEVGFDYSFLLPATGDRVPTVFVENRKVINLSADDPLEVSYQKKIGDRPTGTENPELLKVPADPQHSNTIVNGVSRIGFMAGGESAEWVDEEFPYVFNDKAKAFINKERDKPFFLFYSFHDIHVPRIPHDNFKGKSEMGPRGDAIAQVDWVVGEIVKEIEAQGMAENTLIIFTSDNGPVLNDGYEDQAVELLGTHNPSGPFRGGKYSIFEAGTRVPTLTYWPGTIAAKRSDAMMNQVDLLASLAALVEVDASGDVLDSENHLDAWLGNSTEGRKEMLEEAYTLAFRDGNWKYIAPFEGENIPNWMANKDIESGLSHDAQLYNLAADQGEQHNLAFQYPEKIKAYHEKLMAIKNKE